MRTFTGANFDIKAVANHCVLLSRRPFREDFWWNHYLFLRYVVKGDSDLGDKEVTLYYSPRSLPVKLIT